MASSFLTRNIIIFIIVINTNVQFRNVQLNIFL